MNAYMVNSVNILAISLLIKLGNADIPVSWLDYSMIRVLPSFDYIGECQIILFKSMDVNLCMCIWFSHCIRL